MTEEVSEQVVEPTGNRRRVYDLPHDLVDRIVDYQKNLGLSSEVEAVRRLLDETLKRRDTLEDIVGRFITISETTKDTSEAVRVVLVGHPLITMVQFNAGGISFGFANPDDPSSDASVFPKARDDIEIYFDNRSAKVDEKTRYEYFPKKPRGERLVVYEEIPF